MKTRVCDAVLEGTAAVLPAALVLAVEELDCVLVDAAPVALMAADRGTAVRPSSSRVPEMTWAGGF